MEKIREELELSVRSMVRRWNTNTYGDILPYTKKGFVYKMERPVNRAISDLDVSVSLVEEKLLVTILTNSLYFSENEALRILRRTPALLKYLLSNPAPSHGILWTLIELSGELGDMLLRDNEYVRQLAANLICLGMQ